jgi:hypothetical protein
MVKRPGATKALTPMIELGSEVTDCEATMLTMGRGGGVVSVAKTPNGASSAPKTSIQNTFRVEPKTATFKRISPFPSKTENNFQTNMGNGISIP